MQRTPAEWQNLFNRFQTTTLTTAQFCRENKISRSYFSLRKKQFLSAEAIVAKTEKNFIPVVSAAAAPLTISSMPESIFMELHLTGIGVLKLPATVAPLWVADFIQALRGA